MIPAVAVLPCMVIGPALRSFSSCWTLTRAGTMISGTHPVNDLGGTKPEHPVVDKVAATTTAKAELTVMLLLLMLPGVVTGACVVCPCLSSFR